MLRSTYIVLSSHAVIFTAAAAACVSHYTGGISEAAASFVVLGCIFTSIVTRAAVGFLVEDVEDFED